MASWKISSSRTAFSSNMAPVEGNSKSPGETEHLHFVDELQRETLKPAGASQNPCMVLNSYVCSR